MEDATHLFGALMQPQNFEEVGLSEVVMLTVYVGLATVLSFSLLSCGSVLVGIMAGRNRGSDSRRLPPVGIDLGTTMSCVAYWSHERDRTKVIKVGGSKTTPSVVSFDPDSGEMFVGAAARERLTSHPRSTISHVKRLMGIHMTDDSLSSDEECPTSSRGVDLEYLPYRVVSSGRDTLEPLIAVKRKGKEKLYSPEDISSRIIHHLKTAVEQYFHSSTTVPQGIAAWLGSPSQPTSKLRDAVIAVPAYFNDRQRVATRTAGELAGLNVLRVISEPTAAALSYGLTVTGEKVILVFDFGGGTFDVSILKLSDGDQEARGVEVLATAGDCCLGGADIDHLLCEHLMRLMETNGSINRHHIFSDSEKLSSLLEAAEAAKITLSSSDSATIDLSHVFGAYGANKCITIQRAEFEDICTDLFSRCLGIVSRALDDAALTESDIDEVLLVGGSTRIPGLRKLLSTRFGGIELCTSVDPDEAVARGAAIQAALLLGERTTGLGDSKLRDMLLFDMIPLAIGYTDPAGEYVEVFPRNTPFPAQATHHFISAEDGQRAIYLDIVEVDAVDDTVRSAMATVGIPLYKGREAAAGEREVAVQFRIDEDGCIQVTSETLHVPVEPLLRPSGILVAVGYLAAMTALGVFVYST